jgi:hypothetical protein
MDASDDSAGEGCARGGGFLCGRGRSVWNRRERGGAGGSGTCRGAGTRGGAERRRRGPPLLGWKQLEDDTVLVGRRLAWAVRASRGGGGGWQPQLEAQSLDWNGRTRARELTVDLHRFVVY